MTDQVATLDYERFGVSPDRGFLPADDPPTAFDAGEGSFLHTLDGLARDLPDLLAAGELRPTLRALDPPEPEFVEGLSEPELVRVYGICGFLASAYVHEIDAPSVDSLPAGVAVPLYEATDRLGRTPMLSYDTYVLTNWARRNPARDIVPHNLRSATNFVDLSDESWFVSIHVAIEAAAGPAVGAIGDLQQGVRDDDTERVRDSLRAMEDALHEVTGLFERMPEHNEPINYGTAFRQYLGGFDDVVYEGVDALEGPQSYRGGSGAQSSIFPALDAALGISHEGNPLIDHLETLQRDMPPAHHEFIAAAHEGPDLCAYIRDGHDDLRPAYDDCLDGVIRFRERHVNIVGRYLSAHLDDPRGTGGTPYSRFLGRLAAETRESKL